MVKKMKKRCDACGKKHDETVLIDSEDDEKIYYCRKCHLKLREKIKNRITHTRNIFKNKEKKLPR